ncbi:hypothetical protein EE612_052244, partial [Oryza sativa]
GPTAVSLVGPIRQRGGSPLASPPSRMLEARTFHSFITPPLLPSIFFLPPFLLSSSSPL